MRADCLWCGASTHADPNELPICPSCTRATRRSNVNRPSTPQIAGQVIAWLIIGLVGALLLGLLVYCVRSVWGWVL